MSDDDWDAIEAAWPQFWPEFLDGVIEMIDQYQTSQELGERLEFKIEQNDGTYLLRLDLGVPVWDAFVTRDGEIVHFQPVF